MRKLGLSLLGAAGLVAAAAIGPANAATVEPNGSLSITINGPNTLIPTGNISDATTVLNISGAEAVGSFVDPFLGNPNNFCSTAGGGCLAANPPGYLAVGDTVVQSASGFTVFTPGSGTHPFVDNVSITHGANSVAFDFTSIFTSVLTPTTSTVSGSLTLDLLGTFASDTAGVYTLGQSASMAIACGQTSLGSAISCSKTISTPSTITPPTVPEPASLALLGSALVGFGAFRRRRSGNKAA